MKSKTHQTVTRLSFEYCKNELDTLLYENRKLVIEGVKDEDNFWEFKRLLHWHFYRAENSPIPQKIKFIFKPTSEQILAHRIKRLKSYSPNKSKYYIELGRILHHIQDMSTPSHVIPIYHDPKIKDNFEHFMSENDMEIILEQNYDTDYSSFNDLSDIYQKSAKQTLQLLLEDGFSCYNNGIQKKIPYSFFWQHYTLEEDKNRKGFGTFSTYEECFKDLKFDDKALKCITKDILLGIQKSITNDAIQNTIKALLFISNQKEK